MKGRLNCYFDAALLKRLDELAARRGLSKSTIVEAALASFLSPDAADQREAAITRRLDKMTRAIERLERDVAIGNEAQALYIRAWLTATPPLPEAAQAAAQAKARERYDSFVEAVGRRVARGQRFAKEIVGDIESRNDKSSEAHEQ
ncbi:CopG family transcriptional regulator [Methylocystis sp. SC2]|uniref:ribbon-helix-helix domain-containing protein n=1 Tax=Methylocystis sp. (strain SC2) TaxID=187303 RepID=UPI00027AE75B|nr:CopG family transcriptional regulator [Methylocystis sp. SC2]CCJ07304.1 CopG domain protein DNA-binding domain protein [Methylocystis sp. SC2]